MEASVFKPCSKVIFRGFFCAPNMTPCLGFFPVPRYQYSIWATMKPMLPITGKAELRELGQGSTIVTSKATLSFSNFKATFLTCFFALIDVQTCRVKRTFPPSLHCNQNPPCKVFPPPALVNLSAFPFGFRHCHYLVLERSLSESRRDALFLFFPYFDPGWAGNRSLRGETSHRVLFLLSA